jgi:hypothetical protein
MYFAREKEKEIEKVWCYFEGRVECDGSVQRRGMQHVAPEKLLGKLEGRFAHYLVENKIAPHCTHVLSSSSAPMPPTVLPAKQNQKSTFSFHHPLPNK